MQITTIKYEKLFSLGNHEDEKMGVEITLSEGEEPVNAHMKTVKYVEHGHCFQKEYSTYQQAKEMAESPMNYTSHQVQQARQTGLMVCAASLYTLALVGLNAFPLRRASCRREAASRGADDNTRSN